MSGDPEVLGAAEIRAARDARRAAIAFLRGRLSLNAVRHGRYGTCWNERDATMALDVLEADGENADRQALDTARDSRPVGEAPDVERLARAILVAAKEDGRRPTSDGFEWYGSADEMAEGILSALQAGQEAAVRPAREIQPVETMTLTTEPPAWTWIDPTTGERFYSVQRPSWAAVRPVEREGLDVETAVALGNSVEMERLRKIETAARALVAVLPDRLSNMQAADLRLAIEEKP